MATGTLKSLHKSVQATLRRLEEQDPGLRQLLKDAYGYAVFPSVGKAALVLGGAYGRGEVYERGKPIGYATIAQTTIGVQIGGDTFDELLVFESKEALERFKKGKLAFAANASAVLVKAGAAGTADYEKGVMALAYAKGGMLLEVSIGGQKFKFKPLDQAEEEESQRGQKQEGRGRNSAADEEEEGPSSSGGGGGGGILGRATGGLRSAASSTTGLVKQHPWATLAGAGLTLGALWVVRRALQARHAGAGGKSDQADDESQDQGGAQDEQDQYDEDQQGQSDVDEGDESQEQNGGGGRLFSRGRSR